jgi:hypothetical protein
MGRNRRNVDVVRWIGQLATIATGRECADVFGLVGVKRHTSVESLTMNEFIGLAILSIFFGVVLNRFKVERGSCVSREPWRGDRASNNGKT